tara:strand:- start:1207 stop:1740 length:534 start_codon:yes stop_codon:yes gene_type:complete
MKDSIKTEAIRIVRMGGSHSLNFRDLGNIVGVKSSSIHYYFPTKSDLLAEIVKDYGQNFMNELERRTQSVKTLAKTLEIMISFCEESQKEKLICLCGSLATEASGLEPQVVDRVRSFFSTLEGWISQKIKFYKSESDLSRIHLSKVIVSLIEGALIVDRANDDSDSLEAAKAWVKTL